MPVDRLWLGDKRGLQHLPHSGNRDDPHARFHVVGDFHKILLVLLWNDDRLDPGSQGGQKLFLQTSDRQDAATQGDFTRHRHIAADRYPGQDRDDRRGHGNAGGRSVLGRCPFRHVNMNVHLVERGRLDAIGGRLRPHIRPRGVNRLLHHIAEFAGRLHTALAGQHDRFDLQRFAANLGPGQPGHDTDLILAFDLAEAEFPHTGKIAEIVRRDLNRRRLVRDDFLHRLAGKVCDLALKITDTRLTRVIADQVTQAGIGDLPLVVLQTMRLRLLRDQMAFGDFDLFILGVAGDADDLHAIHQGLRHAQRVGRGDEHYVRKIEIDFQIMIVESRVLLRIQHLQQRARWIAAPVGAQLVDLIQQEERV